MYQIVYVSTAAQAFDDQALASLLDVSRRNNANDDVTGMLLYHEGSFFQVLEGKRQDVENVLARVEQDARHRMVTVLMEQEIEERAFGDWSMAYRPVAGFDPKTVPGFSDYLLRPANEDSFQGSSEAFGLLNTFRQYLR
jgi:hypothetical protein